jgi:hypothetical protein
MRRLLGWFLAVAVLTAALPAAGQSPAGKVVAGSISSGQIPSGPVLSSQTAGLLGLPGLGDLINLSIPLPGVPLATLSVSFEQGLNLNLLNLGAGVQLISPNDPSLLARLPPGVTIAPELPLLIRIEPPPAGGLTFTGIARIQVLTPTLLPAASPRLLYAAPLGGLFLDNTDQNSSTLYRASGSRSGFSEFLVVIDPTPPDQAVAAKLARLSQILAANSGAIAAPVRAELATRLAAVQAHWAGGDTAAALAELELFLATVEQHSGSGIPDVWRAARDRVNVAGELRAAARTLRFSLRQDLGP